MAGCFCSNRAAAAKPARFVCGVQLGEVRLGEGLRECTVHPTVPLHLVVLCCVTCGGLVHQLPARALGWPAWPGFTSQSGAAMQICAFSSPLAKSCVRKPRRL